MSRRSSLAALLVSVTVLLAPGRAVAGGWWSSINLESSNLGVGETVVAGTEFLFASVADADRAREVGGFHAYLLVGYDFASLHEAMNGAQPPNWWSLGRATALRVGDIELDGWDGNLATAHARFEVPELHPGTYALAFCSDGCVEPLGDIVPSEVTVVVDPISIRHEERLVGLEDRLLTGVRALSDRITSTRREAAAATREADASAASIASLERRIQMLERSAGARPATPWLPLLGAFASGLAASMIGTRLVARRRRRRRAVSFDPGEVEWFLERSTVPEDAGASAGGNGRSPGR